MPGQLTLAGSFVARADRVAAVLLQGIVVKLSEKHLKGAAQEETS